MTAAILSARCGAFARECRGAVAIIVAGAAIPLFLAAGAAIDLGRAYMVETRLIHALDAAALAIGTKTFQTDADRHAYFLSFMAANYPAAKLGTLFDETDVVVDSTISVSARANVETIFLRVIGQTSIEVFASAQVIRQSTGVEVALVLDNSISMNLEGRIDSLRAASLVLVDTLHGTQVPGANTVKISVVPFTSAVNIGIANAGYVSSGATTYEYPTYPVSGPVSWSGCVAARDTPGDIVDSYDGGVDPATGNWRPYFWEAEAFQAQGGLHLIPAAANALCRNRWWEPSSDIARIAAALRANGVRNTVGAPSFDTADGSPGTFRQTDVYLGTPTGPNRGCPQPIVPLTTDKITVEDAINSMTPVEAGGTIIGLGAAWGWRALSPNLPFDEGLPYEDTNSRKAMIILTDGDIDIGGNGGACQVSDPRYESQYSAYGYPLDNRLTGNRLNDITELEERFAGVGVPNVCDNIKAAGVEIYTIAFGSDALNGTIPELLQNCATSPDHYNYAPDAATLEAVFRDIGRELSNLRIAM